MASSLTKVRKSIGGYSGQFFCRKVEFIREEIDGIIVSSPPMNIGFLELNLHFDIINAPSSSWKFDPVPTLLLKLCVNELTPVITKMVNLPVYQSCVPEAWKLSRLVLILKKLGLDPLFENYRPINNLSFVSKIAERAVIGQLLEHCNENAPLPPNQSAYRWFHSTETALVKVQNDILMSMDQRDITFLCIVFKRRF